MNINILIFFTEKHEYYYNTNTYDEKIIKMY